MAIGTVNFHLQARGIAEPSKLKSETPPHKKMLAAEKKSYLAGIWGKPITNEAAHAQAGGQTAAAAEKKLSFAPGTKWVTLQTSGEVADPPLPDCFHAPTDPDCVGGVKKMDYGAVFDRDEFTTKPDPKTKKRTTPKKKGGPNPKFVSLHKLGVQSRPVDWYRSLIPRRRDYDKVEGMPKPILTFSDMAMYSNAKAQLCGAGTADGPYPTWKAFSAAEIEAYFGLYQLNGLSPSPQIAMKFKTQAEDPVNGSDLCAGAFRKFGEGSGGAELRYKQFRRFFAVQDPRLAIPNRKEHPMFKVQPILSQFEQTSLLAWVLGETLSGDEQTQHFQGKHPDKIKIKFKKEGDGFQIDAICEDGYTYCFYFRNQPPPKKWTDLGLCGLHARCMAMFETFTFEYHRVHFDNLYNSALFSKAAYKYCKVLVGGVTRKGGKGLAKAVLQEEAKNKTAKAKVYNTVKAAVLKGDPDCPDLVAASVYDQKPVHFLSMFARCLKWVQIEKKVWCHQLMAVVTIQFLRWNINDEYNWGMGQVDISDQLRNQYRLDHWLRQTKWWWSPFMLVFGWFMTNAYVLYDRYMEDEGEAERLSHYDFLRAIALAMIDPERYDGLVRANALAGNAAGGRKRGGENLGSPAAPTQQRRPKLTPNGMGGGGAMTRVRLDSSLNHIPLPTDLKKHSCQLHSFASDGQKAQKKTMHVMRCPACEVYLCGLCYHSFHADKEPKPAAPAS